MEGGLFWAADIYPSDPEITLGMGTQSWYLFICSLFNDSNRSDYIA
jgi:hypothetical protein